MRSLVSISSVIVLLAACGAADEEAPTPGPTVADFAGTWTMSTMLEGTPDPVPSTMGGSADGSDWTLELEGRDPIAVQVSISGDSLVGQTGEYESILQEGVMVSIRTASVIEDGMLNGKLVATYDTPDGVELVEGTVRGTRAPM